MGEKTIRKLIMKGLGGFLTIGDIEMLHDQFGYEAVITSGRIRDFVQDPERREEGRGIHGLVGCGV
jgi:hypothetical protein